MSFQINWHALTGGPEGDVLAETIRAFIHDRFQQVELPKLIRSVKVHAFDFGSVPPELELKDVCDPLPDFYGEDETGLQSETPSPELHRGVESTTSTRNNGHRPTASSEPQDRGRVRPMLNTNLPTTTSSMRPPLQSLPRAQTPGIPGGTSNMSYFHLPLSASLSGAATPLAAVAGGHFGAWPDLHNYQAPSYDDQPSPELRRASHAHTNSTSNADDPDALDGASDNPVEEKSVEDVQIVTHIRYSGDIKLSLTAEILLDYPMPSFVGIPVKLNVTGLTFDGVAVLAYIKKKAHFCFLAPEDAEALIGANGEHAAANGAGRRGPIGGLFEEIKVESEIGLKTAGKQSLKNVGRVEKFVLEQVRRIFETEFVYPSFWTFLV
jgi:distribution and morphology protein 12